MRRPLLLAALLLAAAVPTASAQEPPRIAAGVHAGGVDLSGATVEEAAGRLAALDGPLQQPLVVAVAGKRFTLKPSSARLAFDRLRTAKRAYYAGRDTPPPPGGRLDVPLAIEFRRAVVRDFVARADRAVYIAPRNATARITLRKIYRRKSRAGRDLDGTALRATLEAALVNPAAQRLIKPGRKVVRAPINGNDLLKRYGTVLTVDKANFRLRLFKNYRVVKTYGVAVGLPAYPTPSGLFSITNKAVNPTWTAPNSPWAGEMAGQQVSGGAPNNPLKARWMGIINGVGIHGTGQEYSIGSRASHGCIRMRVRDVIALYPRVPVGTPVLIR